jgi:hypothetical protein
VWFLKSRLFAADYLGKRKFPAVSAIGEKAAAAVGKPGSSALRKLMNKSKGCLKMAH